MRVTQLELKTVNGPISIATKMKLKVIRQCPGWVAVGEVLEVRAFDGRDIYVAGEQGSTTIDYGWIRRGFIVPLEFLKEVAS